MPVQKIFDSSAEEKVNIFLHDLVDTDHYQILSQVCVSSVFEELTLDENFEKRFSDFCDLMECPDSKDIKCAHSLFDFVIYDRLLNLPVVILEVNGRQHVTNKSKRILDLFKQFMAGKNNIPFITLKLYLSYSDDDIKTMLWYHLDLINNLFELPRYCSNSGCQSRLEVRQRKDKNYFYFCPNCMNASGNNITYSVEQFPLLLKP